MVGAPSCRKTTTAEQVKIKLKLAKINAEICPEYARTYIRDTGPISSPLEQLAVFHGQRHLEHQLEKVHDIVICDSAQFLGYPYCRTFLTPNPKEEAVTRLLHGMCVESIHEYKHIFYLPPDGSEVFQDGIRIQNNEMQEEIAAKINAFLCLENIGVNILTGTVNDKVEGVLQCLVRAGDVPEKVLVNA
jgi:hypothetical protein